MIRTATILSVAAATGIAGAGVNNLLGNGGFEDGIDFNFPADQGTWTAFFGSGVASADPDNDIPTMPRSGLNALTLGDIPNEDNFVGVLQPVLNLEAGTTYEFSVWAKTFDPVVDDLDIRIEFRDANGDTIGDPFADSNLNIAPMLTEQYQQFAISAAAPEGTVSGQVVIGAGSFDGNGMSGGLFSVDDTRLVPAPGAATLLALAGLGAARRRR